MTPSWRLPIVCALLALLSACRRAPVVVAHREKSATSAASTSAAPPFQSRALALAWTGAATLAFDAQRLEGDHTLFTRFMPAYEGAYRGVIVADQSGRYRLAMAPYASLNQPAIEVVVGSSTLTVPLAAPRLSTLEFTRRAEAPLGARWLSLALSVRGSEATVYLNGVLAGSLVVAERHFGAPLVLGRLARPEAVQDQFYGLIDDVAIFDRAFSAAEVLALSRAPRFDARLAGLIALGDFDRKRPSSRTLEPVTSGVANLAIVSGKRDDRADAAQFPAPEMPVRLSLPFAAGQTWIVIQGWNSVGSHHDTAAFSLDFQRVDPRVVAYNPEHRSGASAALSAGQPFFAAADGQVVSLVDCFREDGRGCSGARLDPADGDGAKRNLMCIEHAARFVSCYLHLKSAKVALGARVVRGALLGEVGSTGTRFAHLHFAMSDLAEPSAPGGFSDLATIPFGFSDYEASDDFGRSFNHIDFGMPRAGQWVRARTRADTHLP